MKTVFFDVETLPSQLPWARDEIAAAIEPPGNISKAETIAAWHADKKPGLVEEAYLKTSFDGGMGQACVIGWAIDDGPANAICVKDFSPESERDLLGCFFSVLADMHGQCRLAGHNIIGFDLPFLWKRAMVLNVKPPFWFPRNPKPWAEAVVDTMFLWDQQQRAGGSMDRLCRLFGLPGKGDMDGSKVWPMAQAGRMSDIADYCRGDVERTRALYRRMTFEEADELVGEGAK